ncbi:MAG TPA: hypothetical protein VMY36_04615 [Patescibacteria group bacterium]|nr:hypothetical protein [Patescibacteria group bacterium]
MKPFLAQISKLSFLTLVFISPLVIANHLSSPKVISLKETLTPAIAYHSQNQLTNQNPTNKNKTKFAVLLAQNPQPKVLGTETTKDEEKEEKTESSQTTGTYTIALLGDSMIDVMQPDLPQLEAALKKYYPQAQFKLLNYGVGASNIEYGLTRLTKKYTYLGREFPALLSQNPNIIVIESFAYNHWDNNQTGLDRQWLALGGIIQTIKNQSQTKIVLAATIAPNENTLCNGIDGINLPPDQKKEKAQTIKKYLNNLINFANSQNYPLADAYHPSLNENENGQAIYINEGDHLHPSGPGGELFAEKIAEAIFKNKLL